MKTGPKPRTLAERFIAFISPEPNSGCWLWTGAASRCGYGRVGVGGKHGGMMPAHRAAWTIFRGSIPAGFEVGHRCDTRLCVNPDHLWLCSHTENMADQHRKGRNRNGVLRGDEHPRRRHPEKWPSGDDHWTRKKPHLLPRGEDHWRRRKGVHA